MIKKSLLHPLLYGLSIALMKGISLLMLPFIAHYLSPDEFGKVEILSSLTVIGSVLVGLGLEDSLYRFAGMTTHRHKRRYLASVIFTLASVITVISIVVILVFGAYLQPIIPGNIPTQAILLALSIVALESMISVPLGWLRMNDRAVAFFVATTGRVILQAGLTLVLLQYAADVTSIFIAGLLSALAQMVFLCVLQLQDCRFTLNFTLTKRVFSYSLPILISGLVGFVLMGLDRWFIASLSTLEAVAIYGVAAKFALGVVLLLQPYTMWWSPQRFQALQAPDGTTQVVQKLCLGLGILTGATFVVITCSTWFVGILMPSQYHAAISVLWVLAVAMAGKEAAELVNIGCFIHDSTRLQMHLNIMGAIIGVLAMSLLIPMYGAVGAAWALVIAQWSKCVGFYYYSQQQLPLAYPLKWIVGALALMSTLAAVIVWQFTPFSQVVLCVICLIIIAGSCWWLRDTQWSLIINRGGSC